MARLVHLAGPMIQVRSQCRQRCVWCGTIIQDIDLQNVSVMREEGDTRRVTVEDLPSWVGLVAIDGDYYEAVEDRDEPQDPTANAIPADSCMNMPFEETR